MCYVLNNLQHDLTETVKLCSDRSKVINIHSECLVLCLVCLNSKIIYFKLKQKINLNISQFTIYWMFKEHDIINWLFKKCSLLTFKAADKRYIWVKTHKNWVYNNWKKIIWSNKCFVKWDAKSQYQWVFHLFNQKWQKNIIQFYKKNKDCLIII